VTHATDLGKVVTRLQLERGDVAFYIYTNNTMLRDSLTHRFDLTNEAINNMTSWTEIIVPASPNDTEEESEVMLNRTSFLLRLNDFRNQIISEENRENSVFEVSTPLVILIFTFFSIHHTHSQNFFFCSLRTPKMKIDKDRKQKKILQIAMMMLSQHVSLT
jgi:hypothetical protein